MAARIAILRPSGRVLETSDGTVVLVIVADGATQKSLGAITKLAMPVVESFAFGN